jgi:hypothetical protein
VWRGKEPNHTTVRKPGPLYYIEYSLVLAFCSFYGINITSLARNLTV